MPHNRIRVKHDKEIVPKHCGSSFNNAQMRLPTELLFKRFIDRKLATGVKSGKRVGRATSNRRLESLEVDGIVKHYDAIIRGIVNYYSHINQRSDL